MLALEKRALARFPRSLFLQTELLDERVVAALIILLEVAQVRSSISHHLEKTTSGMEILSVLLKVFGQFLDALRQKSYLDACRTVIGVVMGHLFDDGRLFLRA